MHEFIRNTFSRQKLHQLCVNTALGTLALYIARPLLGLFLLQATVSEGATSDANALLTREIAEATTLAEKLREIADSVDNHFWIGTAYNEVDAREHTCYVLGLFLDQKGAVAHLRLNRNPSLLASNSSEAHSRRVEAHSLDNFVLAANRVTGMSHSERAMEWNLDCLGQLGIRGTYVEITGASTFYLVKDKGTVLQILGSIEPGFATKLRQAIERNPSVMAVSLGSNGGSVYEAIEAGRLIRAKRLETALWNNCYSACPLVFAGGVSRTIMSPYPSLGFHRMYSEQGSIPLNSRVYRDVLEYLAEMGVSPQFVLDNMLKAAPSGMYIVPGASKELCDYKLATWVQRSCQAE